MAKKVRYYYDSEECCFKEEKDTPRSLAKKILTQLAISLVVACVGLGAYFFLYNDPKHLLLKQENSELLAKIDKNLMELSKLEASIEDLHKRDNEFYRSILNADQIPPGVWKGGLGGSADYEPTNRNFNVQELERRIEQISHKIQVQTESFSLLEDLANANAEKLQSLPAIKPVPGRLVSTFGMRFHPILKYRRMHYGLDLQASVGTPVYATGDGVISMVKKSRHGYGNQVEVDHGYGYITRYAHLKEFKVAKGQKVKRGDVIALTGNTGLSKGPHLHYEVMKSGRQVDPLHYFYADHSPEEYLRLKQQAEALKDSPAMDWEN